MPQASVDFNLGLPRSQVWSLLNDLDRLGRCVPGCEEMEVLGKEESRWKVKVSMGIISKTVQAKATVVRRSEPGMIGLKIESADDEIVGSWNLELAELAPNLTRVRLVVDITAGGAFKPLVNHIMKSQLTKLVAQFSECIAKTESTK